MTSSAATMSLRIASDDDLKHRYAVTQKELLDERIITLQLREDTAELPGIKAAQEAGPGGFARRVIRCHLMQETSVQSALDDVASNIGGYCSPHHRVPFNSIDEGSQCVG